MAILVCIFNNTLITLEKIRLQLRSHLLKSEREKEQIESFSSCIELACRLHCFRKQTPSSRNEHNGNEETHDYLNFDFHHFIEPIGIHMIWRNGSVDEEKPPKAKQATMGTSKTLKVPI